MNINHPNRQSRLFQGLGSSVAFTLVEVMVSAVILGMISVASGLFISTVMRSQEMAHQHTLAVNLLQKSQEEVLQAAQTYFDDLEDCQFPQPGQPGSCGFSDSSQNFPGFLRQLEISPSQGQAELKRTLITVNWQDLNQPRQMQSLSFVSRPSEPMPGNIHGIVRNAQDSSLLGNVQVQVTPQGEGGPGESSNIRITVSGDILKEGANFNFADAQSGRFMLPPGEWNLSASHTGFQTYSYPESIFVNSHQEIFVEFSMVPRPENAVISGRVFDRLTGQPLPNFSGASINLYGTGQLKTHLDNQPQYRFEVEFENSQEQCLTVNTRDAYRLGYTFPVNQGGLPSCEFAYNPDGWSSAVIQEDFTLICSHPWNGAEGSDRLCVDPAEILGHDIFLETVPIVQIRGRVLDDHGQPISGALVYARWPQPPGERPFWKILGQTRTATTASDGTYLFSVPAVQGLFPNGNPSDYHLIVYAEKTLPVLSCCNQTQNELRRSQTIRVGPLFPGDPLRLVQDLIISTNRDCGNVTGRVKNDLTESPLSNVSVIIRSQSEPTDGGGRYIFQCSEEGFRLATGQSVFEARKTDYYDYTTNGNFWYAPRAGVNITSNTTVQYDGKLWPKSVGSVEVNVIDQVTRNPVPGARVQLHQYFGSGRTLETPQNGRVLFDNVPETWPSSQLPEGDPYYQYSHQGHSISVDAPGNYTDPDPVVIEQLITGQQLVITVELVTRGGV